MSKKKLKIYYEDPLIYRDILLIIIKYVDNKTWRSLKQCCKLFNSILVKPPVIDLTFSGIIMYYLDDDDCIL